ncbi:MAG: hypothetical protein R6U32_03230 [Candidatus Woesearchaeota archaeon]
MGLEVIHGGLYGRDEELASLRKKYEQFEQEICKLEGDHNKIYPFLLMKRIEEAIRDGGIRACNDESTRIFMDELSPSLDIPPGIRPAKDIIFDGMLWDMEEPLDCRERSYMFSLFAEDITFSYLYSDLYSLPDEQRHELIGEFSLAIHEAIERLYKPAYMELIRHNDFYRSLYEGSEHGIPNLFRNAWALWHQSVGDYAMESEKLRRVRGLGQLAEGSLESKDLKEAGMHLSSLEKALAQPSKEVKYSKISRFEQKAEYIRNHMRNI